MRDQTYGGFTLKFAKGDQQQWSAGGVWIVVKDNTLRPLTKGNVKAIIFQCEFRISVFLPPPLLNSQVPFHAHSTIALLVSCFPFHSDSSHPTSSFQILALIKLTKINPITSSLLLAGWVSGVETSHQQVPVVRSGSANPSEDHDHGDDVHF